VRADRDHRFLSRERPGDQFAVEADIVALDPDVVSTKFKAADAVAALPQQLQLLHDLFQAALYDNLLARIVRKEG